MVQACICGNICACVQSWSGLRMWIYAVCLALACMRRLLSRSVHELCNTTQLDCLVSRLQKWLQAQLCRAALKLLNSGLERLECGCRHPPMCEGGPSLANWSCPSYVLVPGGGAGRRVYGVWPWKDDPSSGDARMHVEQHLNQAADAAAAAHKLQEVHLLCMLLVRSCSSLSGPVKALLQLAEPLLVLCALCCQLLSDVRR
jgi:hypothetical protein